MPSDINLILDTCLNKSAHSAYTDVYNIQLKRGLSLVDIISRLHELCVRVSFAPPVLEYLLDKLSDIEYRLTLGSSEKLQLAAMVGVFQIVAKKSNDYIDTQQNQNNNNTTQHNIQLMASDYDNADLV